MRGEPDVHGSMEITNDYFPFVYLVTVLLFARSSLYARASQRPGLSRIIACLFQVMLVAVVYALASGERFQSYYIFYGGLFVATVYVAGARHLYERVTGWLLRAAGYRRRAMLVGSGEHIDACRPRAGRARRRPGRGRRATSRSSRGPTTACARWAVSRTCRRSWATQRVEEVIIADPDFPQEQAFDLVDRCHAARGHRAHRALDDGDPDVQRAEFVPGQSVPLFELKPPVFEGFDYALKRTFDVVVARPAARLARAGDGADLGSRRAQLARWPVLYRSTRPGIGGVPFACLKFRTMHSDAEQVQADLESANEASGAAVQDPRRPAPDPGRAASCGASRSTSCPSSSTCCAATCRWSGRGRCRCATSRSSRTGTRSATSCCRGSPACGRSPGRAELDFDDLVRLDFIYLERWSVFLDLSIMLKTIPAVLSRRGAF